MNKYSRNTKTGLRYSRNPETVEKSPLGLFRRTSALPALIVGFADNSHSCADRSVFCPGRVDAVTLTLGKKLITKACFAGKIDFFDKLTGCDILAARCIFCVAVIPNKLSAAVLVELPVLDLLGDIPAAEAELRQLVQGHKQVVAEIALYHLI